MGRPVRLRARLAGLVPLLAGCLWGVGAGPAGHAQVVDAAFPKVTLRTQDNKEVRFYEDVVKGKVVVVNFMYTKCEGKLCGEGMENLVQVQKALGDRLGRDVFMVSLTLDPEHDTPAVLKEYADRHGVKPGWTFLTGKEGDITLLRRKLGLYNSDPKIDADRKQHTGMIKIGNEALDKWTSTSILTRPQRILQLIERVQPTDK